MGPYTCTHENCGKRTLNDSHLCDEHDPDQQPDCNTCDGSGCPECGMEDENAEKDEEEKPFLLPRDFYSYEDYCDRRDYRENR